MRHKTTINFIKLLLSASAVMSICSPLMADDGIYAVGCSDNFPYEYLNDAGVPSGFSVDLLKRLSEDLNVNCRIELVPYARFTYLKNNPGVDIVLGMIRGDSDREYSFFKTNFKIHFSIFSNTGLPLSSITDLNELRVIIAANEYIAEPVMFQLGKTLRCESLSSADELKSLTLLKRNECDAVLIAGPSARKIMEKQNLIGMKELPVNIGYFDYGFGIRKGRDEFREALTGSYDKMFYNGEYGAIYDKWFAPG